MINEKMLSFLPADMHGLPTSLQNFTISTYWELSIYPFCNMMVKFETIGCKLFFFTFKRCNMWLTYQVVSFCNTNNLHFPENKTPFLLRLYWELSLSYVKSIRCLKSSLIIVFVSGLSTALFGHLCWCMSALTCSWSQGPENSGKAASREESEAWWTQGKNKLLCDTTTYSGNWNDFRSQLILLTLIHDRKQLSLRITAWKSLH